MKPVDVEKRHEGALRSLLNGERKIVAHTRLKLGDHVRLSKHKGIFEKGYTMNYGTEIFKIIKISKLFPELYYLEDYKGENIDGGFYRQEILKVINQKREEN